MELYSGQLKYTLTVANSGMNGLIIPNCKNLNAKNINKPFVGLIQDTAKWFTRLYFGNTGRDKILLYLPE